jgi:hypothetical protein
MRGVTNVISGHAATSTGTAKVNITETVNVDFRNNTVDFGGGSRNSSYASSTECNLSTLDNSTVPTCWVNDTPYFPKPFLLENSGNVYVNITINSSTATTFINGTIIGGTTRYGWKGTSGDRSGARAGCGAGTDLTKTFTDFSGSPQALCKNLSTADTEDWIGVEINVSIPSGPTGVKTVDIVFQAVKNY